MIRFLRKPIVNQVKSILKPIHPQPVLYYSPSKFFSDAQKPNPNKDSTNKYKEEFQELKSKIQANKTQEELKQKAKEETINEFKEKISGTFKGNEKATEGSNKAGTASSEQKNSTDNASQASGQNQANSSQASDQASGQAAGEGSAESQAKAEEVKKQGLIDKLSEKSPLFGKVANFVAESWDETFPKSKFQSKTAEVKRRIKEEKEKEAQKVEYTEEELAKMQESIPEHRRTAVANFEGEVEKKTRAELLKERIKEKLLQTEVGQTIIKSEEYKEYQDFRKEMKQFKEDLKDNLSQSQNRAVLLSMAAIDKVTSESNTATAIKEMRRYDKDFDMFDLEMDAREIFLDIYNAFLQNNIEYLEKVCSDMALAYFKVLLKKREVDDVHPKYDRLWEIEPAQLVGGKIPEKSLPCFTFTITTQEIQCNIHNKKNKIVDGADDRVVAVSYNFVLKLHDTPDLEEVGHKWCLVEIQPIGMVQQLV